MGTCTRTTITAATRRAARIRSRCRALRRRATRSTSSPSPTSGDPNAGRACRRSSRAGAHLPQQRRDPDRTTPSTRSRRARTPCNGTTGIAYPIANGPVTFDSGELGFNGKRQLPGAPAAGTDTWKTPDEPAARHLHVLLPDPPVHEGCLPRGAADRAGPDPECEEEAEARHGRGQRDPRQARHGGASGEGEGRKGRGPSERVAGSLPGARRQAVHAVARSQGQDQDQAQVLEGRAQEDQGARQGGSRKVVVTATATDRFGKTSTAKAGSG